MKQPKQPTKAQLALRPGDKIEIADFKGVIHQYVCNSHPRCDGWTSRGMVWAVDLVQGGTVDLTRCKKVKNP